MFTVVCIICEILTNVTYNFENKCKTVSHDRYPDWQYKRKYLCSVPSFSQTKLSKIFLIAVLDFVWLTVFVDISRILYNAGLRSFEARAYLYVTHSGQIARGHCRRKRYWRPLWQLDIYRDSSTYVPSHFDLSKWFAFIDTYSLLSVISRSSQTFLLVQHLY